MLRFILSIFLGYLLLTVFGTHFPLIPDLLVIMILFIGPKSLGRSIGYGVLTGGLLDLTTGLGLYHTVSYVCAGLIIGLTPSTILQTPLAVGIFNTILGTIIIHLSYGVFHKIIAQQFLFMPWYILLAKILINCFCVWIILTFISWNRGDHDEIL